MRRVPQRVTRTRRGAYRLRLPSGERDLLRTLPGQLRDLLGTDDPALERLFPPAYPDDAVRQAEYEGMVRDELAAGRRSALDVMEATIDAERLDEEQVLAWLGALNDLRLVLGTRLDVTEETYGRPVPRDDPSAAQLALYHYLSWLEEQVVEALAAGLPP
jgi:hypothetical protein